MRLHRPNAPIVWTVVLALVAIHTPTLACGTCNRLGDPLALPHPQAIEIAVATRAAIESKVLNDRPLVDCSTLPDRGKDLVDLHKVSAPLLVEAWATQLARLKPKSKPLSVHFIFIDTEEACGLMIRGENVVFDRKPAFYTDTQVITTRATFHALVSGTLHLPEAQKLGLLIIEGDVRASAALPGQP